MSNCACTKSAVLASVALCVSGISGVVHSLARHSLAFLFWFGTEVPRGLAMDANRRWRTRGKACLGKGMSAQAEICQRMPSNRGRPATALAPLRWAGRFSFFARLEHFFRCTCVLTVVQSHSGCCWHPLQYTSGSSPRSRRTACDSAIPCGRLFPAGGRSTDRSGKSAG